ncbi:sugar phosphate isomerase/epimerase family protein [Tropicimonas isoalkanivorans]|uniref:Sugar phosphate isomerase/epimerase n=1 Tax=Tropicimonas isoalkanivorans TaxID=441112 RepID=A0A1I1H3C8_9RHOB|nr:sugar phosphate isomerase/epimerase family protein [Tropicimonas isoalkanivorans]SFC18281.1 Sugar phosphate isomerase/epimerase [Tropicimonas isoalkanivorans]
MRLGLGSYAYRWSIGIKDQVPANPKTPFDLLDAAQALGLDLIQYADNMPLDRLSPEELERLAATAREKGITLEVGTQCFNAEEVSRYLGICRVIGSKIMRVALDAADAEMPVSELAQQLRPLVEDAKSAGIRIAIENHFNYPSPRMVELLDTVNDPALGVCLDVANSICAKEWPEETIAMLAPYTINLHLKDYVIEPDPYGVGFRIRGVPLGEGRADIPWILDQLAHCPDDMSVIVEHWLPLGATLEETIAQEQPWLERTVAAARNYLNGR